MWLGGTWAGGEWWRGYEDKDRKIFHGAKNSPDQWGKFKSQESLANKFGKEYINFTGTVNYETGDMGNTLNGQVENASFVMDDIGRKNFTWHNGTWKNGRFEHGTWENGTWLGGFFNSANSRWLGGMDKDGNHHGKDDSPDKWKNMKKLMLGVYEVMNGSEQFLFDIKVEKGDSEFDQMNAMEEGLKRHGITIPDDCDYYVEGHDIFVQDDDGNTYYRTKKK